MLDICDSWKCMIVIWLTKYIVWFLEMYDCDMIDKGLPLSSKAFCSVTEIYFVLFQTHLHVILFMMVEHC